MTKKHVGVFAFPFSSHPALLLNIVVKLAEADPDVTFSFFGTAKSNRSLFSVSTPENVRHYEVSDGVPEGHVFAGKPQEDINFFLAVADEEFRRGVGVAEEKLGGTKIDCVVADAFLWFTGDMADEMSVPWVALWTGGPCSLSAHFYTDLIRQSVQLQNGSIAGREDEILDFIPGFPGVRLGDLPGGVLFGELESPFSVMLHKMARILPKAVSVPINSFQELDHDLTKDLNSKLNNFLNIGPMNLMSPANPSPKFDEFSCISWLDQRKTRSVAYICFGTVVRPPPQELEAIAEALEETGIPFLWSINDNLKKALPERFLNTTSSNKDSGKIVPWAPQAQVLAHSAVGVFITHAGWNSVLESIGAGLPMISRPFFGDQQINTWMIEKVWKIGMRIEGGVFTKGRTVSTLKLVLLEEEGKRLSEQALALKELAHKAVGPNGSSTQDFKTLLHVITK